MTEIETLNRQFSLPGLVFSEGPGGLIQACIETAACTGTLFLHGGHVTEWTPRGQKPVLWMSRESLFVPGKPIRGGIPICFPWFGPHPTDSAMPAHGTARTSEWSLVRVEATADDGIALELQISLDDFRLAYEVTFGRELQLKMSVSRLVEAAATSSCEIALHTYFAVGDIHSARISGLENAKYIDKMDGGITKPASGGAIAFTGETDRVYINTRDACELIDPVWKRKIVVNKSGSDSTVIWNPWIAKSQRMPDFGDDEWPGMVCIETANVGPNRMHLKSDKSSEITVQIAVE